MEDEQMIVQEATPKKNNRMMAVVGVVVLLGIGGYLLLGKQPMDNKAPAAAGKMTEAPAQSLTAEQEAQVTLGSSTDTTEKIFNITGGSFYFTPNAITVNKGDKVTIVTTNAGGMHNLLIDAYNVKTKVLNTGESETVTFVADKTGSFEYYCSLPMHKAKGMVGTLIVK